MELAEAGDREIALNNKVCICMYVLYVHAKTDRQTDGERERGRRKA